MIQEVDSFRFVKGFSRRMLKNWIKMEPERDIPWTPLDKPLSASRVALISSGGIALNTDKPFDQDAERNNPWWGDPSYRVLPSDTRTGDVGVYHLHICSDHAEQDLNCIFPLEHLHTLADSGIVGSVADNHYSFMGYTLDPGTLLSESVPQIIKGLQEDNVDVVLLIPV